MYMLELKANFACNNVDRHVKNLFQMSNRPDPTLSISAGSSNFSVSFVDISDYFSTWWCLILYII